MKTILLALAWLIAGLLAFGVGDKLAPRDDTDPPGGRSGLKVYTDQRTGCQYVATVFSSLTPRLDGAGKQVGCK